MEQTAGRLAGTIALVTGVGEPFGAAVARSLAAECRQWAMADVRVARTSHAQDEVRRTRTLHQLEGDVPVLQGDILQPEGARAVLREALARFERLDAVVPVVTLDEGHGMSGDGASQPDLQPLLPMVRQAAAAFRRLGGGTIVLAVGMEGTASQNQVVPYLAGFVHAAALAWHRYHIRVNAVVVATPPQTATVPTLGWAPLPFDKERQGQRLQEAARVVRFLVSTEALALTGQTLLASGRPAAPGLYTGSGRGETGVFDDLVTGIETLAV